MAPTKSTQPMIGGSKAVTKSIVSLSRRAISTRTQPQKVLIDGLQNEVPAMGKRKADASPGRNEKGVKRSALGNVTNAVLNAIEDSKKLTRSKTDAKKIATVTHQKNGKSNENQDIFAAPNLVQRAHKVVTRATSRATESTKATVNEATVGLKKVNISANTMVKGKKKTENTVNSSIIKPAPKPAPTTKSDCQITSSELDTDSKPPRRLSDEFEQLENENSHYMSALEDL